MGPALVADAELFRLEALVRWLDAGWRTFVAATSGALALLGAGGACLAMTAGTTTTSAA